jgi:uncharacterized protein YkwD
MFQFIVKHRQQGLHRLLFAAALLLLLFSTPSFSAEKDLAQQTLAEINLARRNPPLYANYLREFRRQFRGSSYLLPGTQVMVRTSEGVKGVDEAIRFLSRQKPLPPLAWSAGLAAAAADLVEEEGVSGAVGHYGRSGSGPKERIELHGEWQGRIAENICYGPDDARQVVMDLIIDDGVPDRGHRKNIFSLAFTKAGAACGPHPGFGTVCVIDFAGEFREKHPLRKR